MHHPLRLNAALASTLGLICGASFAPAALLRVPAEYPTLQAGVDASAVGDTVLVAPGVYMGAGNRGVDFRGKDIALVGEGGPDVTVIDCQQGGRGIYFHSGETRSAVVSGFTIRGGRLPESQGGGAIGCDGASPTLVNLVLQGNSASSGGALACTAGSNPSVSACVMTGNWAHYRHGGAVMVQNSTAVIRDCEMSRNNADCRGGALWVDGSGGVEVTDVTMTGNYTPTTNPLTRYGGAVCVTGSSVVFTSCTINNNRSFYGGGASVLSGASVVFDRCEFVGNDAGYGGGVFCRELDDILLSSCLLLGNRVSKDGGAASFWDTDGNMVACTLLANRAANAGGGIDCWTGSSPSIERCVIASSTHGNAVDCDNSAGVCEPVLDCCDVYGNEGGDWIGCLAEQYGLRGNFWQDPLMCDPGSLDVSLCANSPCLPGNHPQGMACGLVGALGAGCDPCAPVAVERTSWGLIKSLYR